MADKLTRNERSENMRRIRSKNMKPEMRVRSLVHSLGYRFRLHRKELPGKPDLVFGPRRKVIFVHGCFWHQHPDPECKIARLPKSRLDYWLPKLERNTQRDAETLKKLKEAGWSALVVWECETKAKDLAGLQKKLQKFLDEPER